MTLHSMVQYGGAIKVNFIWRMGILIIIPQVVYQTKYVECAPKQELHRRRIWKFQGEAVHPRSPQIIVRHANAVIGFMGTVD
jgi:hypothetical protein